MTPNASSNASGNVFLYILIAVILFGALSFTISKSNDSNPQGELSDASVKVALTSILAYEAQAKMAVNQMVQNGAKIDDIIFDMPSASSFNTGSTTLKLFHPDGGGLQYKPIPTASLGTPWTTAPSAYYVDRYNNVGWTPSSAQEVLFTVIGLNEKICQELNKKISGSSTIPSFSGSLPMARAIIPPAVSGNSAADLTTSACPTCDGKAAACAGWGGKYGYYSVLAGR